MLRFDFIIYEVEKRFESLDDDLVIDVRKE